MIHTRLPDGNSEAPAPFYRDDEILHALFSGRTSASLIPHGRHPGTVEASIGKEATEELAVMVDTFHPLNVTREASRLEDESYPYSWIPPDDADEHARELSARGPEAFPD